MKNIIRVLLLGLVLVLAGIAWKAGQMLPMATGYVAKTMCSEHFVAGRDDLEHIWSDIQDIDPVFGWASYELNRNAGSVASFIGPGLLRTTAVYRKGLGCTIAAGIDAGQLEPLLPGSFANTRPQEALATSSNLNPTLESVLDEAFSEPTTDSHRQTRAVVVLQNGQRIAERYAPGFDPASPLIGWSMSKSITNNLIGLLVGDGLLVLDDPAPVPEWQVDGDPRKTITLSNLLQMSSGLKFDEIYKPGSDATNMLFTEFSAGAYAAAFPLIHDPGSHWSYSSGTSNILARIVRDTVGGTAQATYEFARSRLFGPLGMTSMVLEPDASGSPVGSSFSYATAQDWARLGQFWLQDGQWQGERLLPEGWIEWSTTPAPAAPKGEYGAQFWLNAGMNGKHHAFTGLPDTVFFASGYAGQSVVVFPDEEIVVVRLGFTTDNSWNGNDFLTAVLSALAIQRE